MNVREKTISLTVKTLAVTIKAAVLSQDIASDGVPTAMRYGDQKIDITFYILQSHIYDAFLTDSYSYFSFTCKFPDVKEESSPFAKKEVKG